MKEKNKLSGYELSRQWFDFSFENPDKIKPIHSAIYFFAIEHNNRLGWRKVFGFPTTMVMDAIGVKSYNTYIKALQELVEFGFIEMVERSKNQYSSNIIALSKFNKALDKALDKAFIKHTSKQSESTHQSIDSIIKQENNKTNEQLNHLYNPQSNQDFKKRLDYLKEDLLKDNDWHEEVSQSLLIDLKKIKTGAGEFLREKGSELRKDGIQDYEEYKREIQVWFKNWIRANKNKSFTPEKSTAKSDLERGYSNFDKYKKKK